MTALVASVLILAAVALLLANQRGRYGWHGCLYLLSAWAHSWGDALQFQRRAYQEYRARALEAAGYVEPPAIPMVVAAVRPKRRRAGAVTRWYRRIVRAMRPRQVQQPRRAEA